MQELFSDPAYYYYPKLTTALYSLGLAFSLSTVIAFVYQFTFRGLKYSRNFFQAMVLSSMVAAIVMMAIGDSLARGLGILGALAIIRFRTRIRNPKNIIFIFASLSVGIASGVHSYTVAVAGTLMFSLIAITLHYSPFGRAEKLEGSLIFNLSNPEEEPFILDLLKRYCEELILVSKSVVNKEETKNEYNITFKRGADREELFQEMRSKQMISGLRITTRENVDRV